MTQLLPYVEQGPHYQSVLAWNVVPAPDDPDWQFAVVPVYLSPQDYTAVNNRGPLGLAVGNISANFQVFGHPSLTGPDSTEAGLAAMTSGNARIPASFPDGTSNTVLYSTRFAVCGGGGSQWACYSLVPYYSGGLAGTMGAYFGVQIPNTQGVGLTFQDQPPPSTCNPEYAHAMGGGGLPVAMADGSVRFVSPSISGMTWRCALLPADGLPLGNDWYD